MTHTLTVALVVGLTAAAAAQDAGRADLDADLTAADVLRLHDPGRFLDQTTAPAPDALWRDSTALKYEVTADEQALLTRHGFVVTERVHPPSFGAGLLDVYVKELPVFVSADAVLHAVHMSYDRILADTERAALAPLLDRALEALHGQVGPLAEAYGGEPQMTAPLGDLDVTLTVARRLLVGDVAPALASSEAEVAALLALVEAQAPADVALFGETPRAIDFSQMTPRGHYAEDPVLRRYFRAMMWLGRTEIVLSPPTGTTAPPSDADVRRQAVLAHLVAHAATASGADATLAQIDALLALFVGAPDNVTLADLAEIAGTAGVEGPSDLWDDAVWARYQAALADAPGVGQRIRSQILIDDPTSDEPARPAVAFLLLGQRYVIDSEVLASVVYGSAEHQGEPVRRMLPSGLDVLFALGNDAAGVLLRPELERHPYASALVGARRLVDQADGAFWGGSVYNGWLDAIAALAPPPESERASLPAFMRTGAWWQKSATTQLASWAQLRHDNLLYAKQSYSMGVACFYPHGYVEPVPAFYAAVGRMARTASAGFARVEGDGLPVERVRGYFDRLAAVTDTLGAIAEREVAGVPITPAQDSFLKRAVFQQAVGCALTLDGWYPSIYYGGADQAQELDQVVADLHTAPTDEAGNPVGWVWHGGTGPLDLAVVTADVPGVGAVAFTGPVLSYYETTTTGFERLTDESWAPAADGSPATRPAWVGTYLAGPDGAARPGGPSLADDR